MKFRNRSRLATQSLVAILSLVTVSAQATFFGTDSVRKDGFFSKNKAPEAVPGEIIVGMNHGFSSLSAHTLLKSSIMQVFGAAEVASISSLEQDETVQKVKIKDAKKVDAVISQLRSNPMVRYAEPNFIYRTLLAPGENPLGTLTNDPDFAKQWDMVNTGQTVCNPDPNGGPCINEAGVKDADINVKPLWDAGITGSKNIVVAVIDTGIDYNHPDLKDNIWTNPDEIAGNGVDDDNNGVIDDIHGASFVTSTPSGNPLDDNNHGTHCSGTIGAKGNDGVGITGVNWNVTLMGVKFLSASGSGSLDGALNSIKYATKMGAKIMSNSWGGGGYSQALKDAIAEAEAQGILFVAAAGNDGEDNDSTDTYPANYDVPNVLSVAATNNQDKIAWFSNYGKAKVQVAAPGVAVYSTTKQGGYASYSGTSMACPHISGMAALLWSTNSAYSYQDIKDLLVKTSDPVRKLKNKVAAKGRADTNNAYTNFVPPTNEPDESLWQTIPYTVESAHPYVDNTNATFEVHVPGAKHIRVIFDKVELESGYDFLTVETPAGEVSESFTGEGKSNVQADYIDGEKLVIRLKTDSSEVRWGFLITQVQAIF